MAGIELVKQQTPGKCYEVTVTVTFVRGGTVADETLTLSPRQTTMPSLAELETLIIMFSLLVFALFVLTGMLNEEGACSAGMAANTHTHTPKMSARFIFLLLLLVLL